MRRAIDTHLPHEPTRETRNHFRAEPNGLGEWDLREPPFRVFYDVYEDEQLVYVKAVVFKDRERTYRRGRRMDTHE